MKTSVNNFVLFFLAGWFLNSAIEPTLRAQQNAEAKPAQRVDADIVLRGGTLHLGDGKPAVVGDVAIRGDKIVAVGEFETGKVQQEIDCRGLVVCPGFIDLHNHSDRQVVRKTTRAVVNFVTQGCTTIVTGNCGGGPIEVGKYYDQIDEHGVGVNVVHLLPQGALRGRVIGNEQRRATADELAKMRELTTQAMLDGAWGMSTGLIYVPSSYADTDELVELAKIVGQHGGIYASHIRNENVELLSAVEEAMEIGRRGKLPVHISHFKSSGKDSWGLVRVATEMIDEARGENRRVTADQYPYTASSTSLDATLIPPWARSGGRSKMLARLKDPEQGPRIREAIAKKLHEMDDGQRLQIAYYSPQPKWAGQRVAGLAEQEKVEPMKLVLRIVENGGASIVNHSINEQDVRYVMTRPWVATASDGRAYVPGATVPHPRNYGTFPRKIGHYALGEQAVDLEHAVRSSSGLPADILGLKDRGYLRAGYFADIAVWDPETMLDAATFEDPHNYSHGLSFVFVNGQPALAKGAPTGALAGRPLRHPTPLATPTLPKEITTKIDRLFSPWDKPDSPGCAVGVIHDGRLQYARGYGSANLDYGTPIETSSVFYMASVSKQFTAACIALLAIESKLNLDDEVRKHLPELPEYERPITVRQLIHHTSGLRDYLTLMTLAGRQYADRHSDQDLLQLVCRQKELNFPPGEKHLYCNTGYLLMAEIVRRVSGKSMAKFAQERIFEPLGMKQTHFHDDANRIVPGRALSYAKAGAGYRVSYLANWDKVGSGGLLSTVEDMVRWDSNFHDRTVGGDELYQLMHTRGKLNNGESIDYAFGLVHGEHKGLPTVSHSGSFMGFKTVHFRVPGQRFSVIVLANLGDVNPAGLAKSIADLCLADPLHTALQNYVGAYRSDELSSTYEVQAEGATLKLQHGGKSTVLKSTGKPGAFEAGSLQIKFTRSEETVTGFKLDSGRAKGIQFVKLERTGER